MKSVRALPTIDPTNGLVIDGGGTRREHLSLSLLDRAELIRLIAVDDDGDAALLSLNAKEAREVAEWLTAAAVALEVADHARKETALGDVEQVEDTCDDWFLTHHSGWSVPRFCHRPRGHGGSHCGPGNGLEHLNRCSDGGEGSDT